MRVTDVRCAIIGRSPVVRIVADEGPPGFAPAEHWKPCLKPHVLALREALVDEDPTLVERTVRRIRQRGGFKPWGAAVSAVEAALWHLAGKAAGLPAHRLLTERGLDHLVACVAAMKEVAGDRVGLALDCGPGWLLADAQRLVRRLEPFGLLRVEAPPLGRPHLPGWTRRAGAI